MNGFLCERPASREYVWKPAAHFLIAARSKTVRKNQNGSLQWGDWLMISPLTKRLAGKTTRPCRSQRAIHECWPQALPYVTDWIVEKQHKQTNTWGQTGHEYWVWHWSEQVLIFSSWAPVEQPINLSKIIQRDLQKIALCLQSRQSQNYCCIFHTFGRVWNNADKMCTEWILLR